MPVLSWLFNAGRSDIPRTIARIALKRSTTRSRRWSELSPKLRPVRYGTTTRLPRSSPTDPVLRANPFPEVTDLFCRLPLPTLFYRLEAIHLGDLLRIWVRPGERFKSLRSNFQGPARALRTPQEPRCFAGNNIPISG